MRVIKEFPDPFMCNDGTRVQAPGEWDRRRREIVAMMLDLQYGTMPGRPERTLVERTGRGDIQAGESFEQLRFTFIPKADRPESCFTMDATMWRPSPDSVERKKASVAGYSEHGLPVLVYIGDATFFDLVESGYLVVSLKNTQIEPDKMGNPVVGPARKAWDAVEPGAYTWGSIAIWAWGACRVIDYLVDGAPFSIIDPRQIIISGHSRNGKAALLAGMVDERIALVNPAGSGCGGAGSYLALGDGCEDLAALVDRTRWWAWMHPSFEQFAGHEVELPFDQHFVMSAIAPRPLLRTEGIADVWANPEGTCAAFLATEPVYRFLGVPRCNGIHFRNGGHYQGEEDTAALLAFADMHFFGKKPPGSFKELVCPREDVPRLFSWNEPA